MENKNDKMKICLQCSGQVFKVFSDNLCTICHKKRQKHEDWVRNKEKRQATTKIYYSNPENMAHKVNIDKQYYLKHKEVKLQSFKNYYQNNKEKIKLRRKQFRDENKDEIKIKRQQKRKNKNFVIKECICRRMNEALRTHDIGSGKWFKYLGCTIDELKDWFAHLFEIIDPTMTFDNHGSYWHIDHVRPISSFDFSDESNIFECFSWKNLSPLKKSLNLIKHNKVDENLINIHKNRVNHYEIHIKPKLNQTAQTTADL